MSSERIFVIGLLLTVATLGLLNFSLNRSINAETITVEGILRKERVQPQNVNDIVQITSQVKPILYSDINFIESLPIPEAKSTFINIMLPAILVAKEELSFQHEQVKRLMSKDRLERLDSSFLEPLFRSFRTNSLNELDKRMALHPNSIILAQAAVESGWGKSRFFKEANNVFGVWSMNSYEDRIPAKFTRNGKKVYLKRYADISASIKDYFYTIGKVNAYKGFRTERLKSENIHDLLPYLVSYSERGQDYVDQLALMIRLNNFEQYDSYQIDPQFLN